MNNNKQFDAIIVGGSYSGLASGMALGRASRKVLIIDSGKPCNLQTPYSHNFLTQDGRTPGEIAAIAKEQVQEYPTVTFFNGLAIKGIKTESGFEIEVATGELLSTKKLIFATGIRDILPEIPGFAECWGISVLHCPYCHGYEVKGQKTGIFGNGEYGYEFSALISNWTSDLTLYTNGKSTLTEEQTATLGKHRIPIEEAEIEQFEHGNGHLQAIVFKNGKRISLNALYARSPFVQHCPLPELLGCAFNDEGYIIVDPSHQTTVRGIFASGDNVTRIRTVANAVAMGTVAGMMVNRELIAESF
jgi:thioredoxin reductase